jgi:hypothetical protein
MESPVATEAFASLVSMCLVESGLDYVMCVVRSWVGDSRYELARRYETTQPTNLVTKSF